MQLLKNKQQQQQQQDRAPCSSLACTYSSKNIRDRDTYTVYLERGKEGEKRRVYLPWLLNLFTHSIVGFTDVKQVLLVFVFLAYYTINMCLVEKGFFYENTLPKAA